MATPVEFHLQTKRSNNVYIIHCIKYIAYLSSPNVSGLFSQVNEFHKSIFEVHVHFQ